MIYISCSERQFIRIRNALNIVSKKYCPFTFNKCKKYRNCNECIFNNIKRINTDITPDTPNYSTEAENKAFLQGFNVAVNKMRGEME